MVTMKTLVKLFVIMAGLVMLAACGGSKPMTLADAPVYPGATELKPDDSRLAAVLANNGAQYGALTKSAGVNSKLEQKGYALPGDATWEAVGKFFDDKLKAAGFAQGVGGGNLAGGAANNILNNALGMQNQSNDLFKMNIYSKDKQTLTVMMLTDPSSNNQKTLLLSLNSN
jgi:hypothetical protein